MSFKRRPKGIDVSMNNTETFSSSWGKTFSFLWLFSKYLWECICFHALRLLFQSTSVSAHNLHGQTCKTLSVRNALYNWNVQQDVVVTKATCNINAILHMQCTGYPQRTHTKPVLNKTYWDLNQYWLSSQQCRWDRSRFSTNKKNGILRVRGKLIKLLLNTWLVNQSNTIIMNWNNIQREFDGRKIIRNQ